MRDYRTVEVSEASQPAGINREPVASPACVNRTVPRGRPRNRDLRPREYLTPAEVDHLLTVARRRGRYGHRDAAMILLAYRHGLRVGELVRLLWAQVDFTAGLLHVNRLKRGVPSVHPLAGDELRTLRQLRRDWPESRHMFQSERDAPLTTAGFRKTLSRISEASTLAFPIHPHMLRHAAGYKLANDGRDTRALQHYLGHRNIQHTVRYTEMSAARFEGWWQ
jgi:type 1 fimbriae regulatory protein FimB/type 1 fimbriae regulatory protein FimE